MFPVIYWFELSIVLPLFYEINSFGYIIHCIIGTYLLINVVSNYVAVFLTDTSIEGKFLSSELKPNWKFCEICECITPPRSWHCDVCNVCILKRDHHCNFTSCCIGHYNHRYFIVFLFYFTIAATYCSYFNIFYILKYTSFNVIGFLKLLLPLAAFLFGHDVFTLQFHRLLCILTFVALVAGGTILIYHLLNIFNGTVTYERAKNIKDYDLGNKIDNIKQVLGKKWYLTLLTPFIASELPCDGINWDKIKQLSAKAK
ncbi:hypothetical protein O3M35_002319 [Rhynocoris fuscipes]|uniref:Palmitoyltransferase n=1 Tax=Rhynocoris fuscipes TaxID=488301 RepID=A0AAW1CME8_9HEMI